MSSVVDVWRAVDPQARLLAGVADLGRPVRGVARTRSAPPHLPAPGEGQLLVADVAVLPGGSLDAFLAAVADAGLDPAAVLLAGVAHAPLERPGGGTPVLASERPATDLEEAASAYLADEPSVLERMSADLRLACAEAALADPQLGAPAGLVAGRIRRGVAVAIGGSLATLHARPAGQALAARFAAIHRRVFAQASAAGDRSRRRTAGGLWLLERRLGPRESLWLFDDVPLAAVDEAAAEALSATLRALLRRPVASAQAIARGTRPSRGRAQDSSPGPVLTPGEARLRETLLAVARANGRAATAARALGVHRNTVLYRLRRGVDELGLDPRRPEDALRILAEWGEAKA